MNDTRRKLAHLHKESRGAVIIWVTLMMVVIVGFVGLGIDGARYLNLNSNLQEIADGAALAGAAELDGSADAITRATDKGINFLNNNPKWAAYSSDIQIASDATWGPTFYQTVNGPAVTNPKLATYIKVNTVQRSISLSFSVVSTAFRTLNTRAQAWAKSSFSVCAPLQSFMCNPYEASESASQKGSASNWATTVQPGQMLMLVGGTGGAPGNWGLIQAPAKNGNPHNQAAFWSDQAPANCPSVDIASVSQQVDTGNNGPFAAPGMNVRFDNPVNQLDSTASPVVIDGYQHTNGAGNGNCANSVLVTPPGFQQTNLDGGAAYQATCNTTTAGSCPLPRDRVLTNLGGNSWSTSLKGTGVNAADLLTYWKNHHSGTSIPQFQDPDTGQWVDVTTRWQVYQMESDTTKYPAAANINTKEDSAPYCNASIPAGGLSKLSTSRRLINVAIVDCDYWGIQGASTDLPVTTQMASFFMTEPATSSGQIYAELVKTYQVNGNGSSIFHLVQLVK